MDPTAVVVASAAIFLWIVVSARLERADLTAPIVLMAIGAVLAGVGLVDGAATLDGLRPLVELTLVLVLFSDAARIPVRALRGDAGVYVRLLGVGLPLTILAGWALALWFFPAFGGWLALLLAAALAPTDAALGVPVVTNPVVPSAVRRIITVESGLNDGIATPIVLLAVASAASVDATEAAGLGAAVVELAVGALAGTAVGLIGGALLRRARRAGWAEPGFAGAAVLVLAVAGYATALALHGNGFVAAFCGGLAFGAAAGPRGPRELVFLEQASGLVSMVVWLVFGAVVLPIVLPVTTPIMLLYAVLSLTVVRMVPVALVSIGAGLGRATVLFIGWFGPRGLASLVFALLALEELGVTAEQPVAVIAVTVVLSVLVHGLSAEPLARRYGAVAGDRTPARPGPAADVPVRGLPRRSDAGARPAGPVDSEQDAIPPG